jgi:hypothetical protein
MQLSVHDLKQLDEERILKFDQEKNLVWIFVFSREPFDIRAIPYEPDDWQ